MRYPREQHAVVTAQAIAAESGGRLEEAVTLHTDAAQRWAEFGFMLEEGQALLGASRCLLQFRKTAEASLSLRQARKIFVHLGAKPLVDEADAHLQQVIAISS